MTLVIRPASPTDAPALMHIERACRVARTFLREHERLPGPPTAWRSWLLCAPPFDRQPSLRRAFVAHEHSDIFGFIACSHDSMYAGYRADVAGLYVLPRFRRQRIGLALLAAAAQWLAADGITRMTMTGYERDGVRAFGQAMGGFVIHSPMDPLDRTAMATIGFTNLAEIASHGPGA